MSKIIVRDKWNKEMLTETNCLHCLRKWLNEFRENNPGREIKIFNRIWDTEIEVEI
jgi:hypothetical protein